MGDIVFGNGLTIEEISALDRVHGRKTEESDEVASVFMFNGWLKMPIFKIKEERYS